MAAAGQKVSPLIDLPGAEAPLLDLATLAERVKAIETTPDAPTLHHLATREPTSFHQSTIYYGLVRPDTPPRRRYGLLAASIGIVFLQCFVATGLGFGVGMSTCSEQADCSRGSFCDEGLCSLCAGRHKSCCLPNATDTCAFRPSRSIEREYGEKDREGMCAACTTSKGFETHPDVMRDGVLAMFIQDWVALFLASLVIAFAVFAEIRDGMLMEIALREISKRREVSRGWRFAIHGLNFARYFILFPNILFSVMMLVNENGGRVRDICLNTVAVLFLLEVDNLAFLHGLGERARMEAEEHAGAHEKLTELDLQTLDAVKLVCVLLIPCAVVGGVCGPISGTLEPDDLCFILAPLPSMVLVFVQRVKANGRRGACGGLGWAIVGYLVGQLGWGALFYQMIYLQARGEGEKYIR